MYIRKGTIFRRCQELDWNSNRNYLSYFWSLFSYISEYCQVTFYVSCIWYIQYTQLIYKGPWTLNEVVSWLSLTPSHSLTLFTLSLFYPDFYLWLYIPYKVVHLPSTSNCHYCWLIRTNFCLLNTRVPNLPAPTLDARGTVVNIPYIR